MDKMQQQHKKTCKLTYRKLLGQNYMLCCKHTHININKKKHFSNFLIKNFFCIFYLSYYLGNMAHMCWQQMINNDNKNYYFYNNQHVQRKYTIIYAVDVNIYNNKNTIILSNAKFQNKNATKLNQTKPNRTELYFNVFAISIEKCIVYTHKYYLNVGYV